MTWGHGASATADGEFLLVLPFPKVSGRNRRPWLEPVAWCLLALGAALAQIPSGGAPHIYLDSCQYLSAAGHLRSTHRMETSLVHFDTERSHGTIPAPLTWFPPGYPAAIALVSLAGGGIERAALGISMAAFALVAGLLWSLMRALDAPGWAARAAVLCWLANSNARTYSVAAMSESLFTLAGLASILFLVALASKSDGVGTGVCRIGAMALAGLSYWVRYAGILWVAACLTIVWADFRRRKKGERFGGTAVAATGVAVVSIAPLAIRNTMLVGDWRGGNNTPFSISPVRLAINGIRAFIHTVLGNGTARQLVPAAAIAFVGIVGICVVALMRPPKSPSAVLEARRPTEGWWVLLAASSIYLGGIAAIAFRSVISYDSRMYLPVLPQLIALCVTGVDLAIRRVPQNGWLRSAGPGIAVCLLLGYCVANGLSGVRRRADGLQETQRALMEADATGLSVERRLGRELEPGEAIAATNGQMAGYILRRRTLSLVGLPYGRMPWNEHTLRTEMSRFGTRYLLVFRDAALDPVVQQSQLLAALGDGRATPWLRLVSSTRDLCLYRAVATPETGQ